MTKILSMIAIALALFGLTACVQPPGESVTQAAPVPLTSDEIRTQLAGSSLVGVNGRGNRSRIYVTPSLEARFVDSPTGASVQYELLKNGILCSQQPERRFCYRVFVTGDNIRIAYASGDTEFNGKIAKGNSFTS